MRTLVESTRLCPETGHKVRVEELYELEGTCTCQMDTRLLSWRCLDEANCRAKAACPLHREYAGTGGKTMLDQ